MVMQKNPAERIKEYRCLKCGHVFMKTSMFHFRVKCPACGSRKVEDTGALIVR